MAPPTESQHAGIQGLSIGKKCFCGCSGQEGASPLVYHFGSRRLAAGLHAPAYSQRRPIAQCTSEQPFELPSCECGLPVCFSSCASHLGRSLALSHATLAHHALHEKQGMLERTALYQGSRGIQIHFIICNFDEKQQLRVSWDLGLYCALSKARTLEGCRPL